MHFRVSEEWWYTLYSFNKGQGKAIPRGEKVCVQIFQFYLFELIFYQSYTYNLVACIRLLRNFFDLQSLVRNASSPFLGPSPGQQLSRYNLKHPQKGGQGETQKEGNLSTLHFHFSTVCIPSTLKIYKSLTIYFWYIFIIISNLQAFPVQVSSFYCSTEDLWSGGLILQSGCQTNVRGQNRFLIHQDKWEFSTRSIISCKCHGNEY